MNPDLGPWEPTEEELEAHFVHEWRKLNCRASIMPSNNEDQPWRIDITGEGPGEGPSVMHFTKCCDALDWLKREGYPLQTLEDL